MKQNCLLRWFGLPHTWHTQHGTVHDVSSASSAGIADRWRSTSTTRATAARKMHDASAFGAGPFGAAMAMLHEEGESVEEENVCAAWCALTLRIVYTSSKDVNESLAFLNDETFFRHICPSPTRKRGGPEIPAFPFFSGGLSTRLATTRLNELFHGYLAIHGSNHRKIDPITHFGGRDATTAPNGGPPDARDE